MWTRRQLQQVVRERLSDYKLIIVSNREPYQHTRRKGAITAYKSTGGLVHALDPVMQACDGVWVAHGSGDADKRASDAQGRVRVPPGQPAYTLKRVWLTREEEKGYYYGFSNEALWPLCHVAFARPTFREEDWAQYRAVNRKFAAAVLEEVGTGKAFVWIQDYHLALLPKYLKELSPNIISAHFWHIPWPNPEVWRICPQRTELLEGLLANELLGFHIRYHGDNFLGAVDRELEAKIDREKNSVVRQGHETFIRPFPISVDFEGLSAQAQSAATEALMQQLREEFQLDTERVILGIDRIDYTKGIMERLHAFDRLLDKHPEHKERVTFLQLGQLSRIHLAAYKQLNDEMNALVESINWKHGTGSWTPVRLIRRNFTDAEVVAAYRLGHVCVVSSLHDGMNLVSKEFVSARYDEDGVLVLSQFTGAARELTDALLVNPYDAAQFAEQLHAALTMSAEERKARMGKLRAVVAQHNIYRWAGKVLSELLKFDFQEEPTTRSGELAEPPVAAA